MVARIHTVAFEGIHVLDIDVQVQISSGLPSFTIVGLADKAVAESRERVRAAFHAIGLSLPPSRITVNLAPADQQKEGSHFDLPIALGLLAAMDILGKQEISVWTALGELALDGRIANVSGVLPSALHVSDHALKTGSTDWRGLICPVDQGPEAAWASGIEILGARDLLQIINHFKGQQIISPPKIITPDDQQFAAPGTDLADIKGQETAKRALEIAAAGGHNMLMCGPPGAGKSMMASALPGILPTLDATEILEVSMIHSLAGLLKDGQLNPMRPFRDPHHSASMAALVGGGHNAKPGEVSLAHLGVLFLDELPEFQRAALEALRQPLETGTTTIARANAHLTYPARVQMIAAMNPCRCGHLNDAARACSRAPGCARTYQDKISGPLIDRIDLHVQVPALDPFEMSATERGEASQQVRKRVERARHIQRQRYATQPSGNDAPTKTIRTNAEINGQLLDQVTTLDHDGQQLLRHATQEFSLSGRGYSRVLKVARTIADLDESQLIFRNHLAEALSFRYLPPGQNQRPLQHSVSA